MKAPNHPCEVCALIGVHTPTPLGEKICPKCKENVAWAEKELREKIPDYEKTKAALPQEIAEAFQDHIQECVEKVRPIDEQQ